MFKSKLVEAKVIEKSMQTQSVIINGVQKILQTKFPFLCIICPSCRKILYETQLDENTNNTSVINRWLRKYKVDFNQSLGKHCPNCGQELRYDELGEVFDEEGNYVE